MKNPNPYPPPKWLVNATKDFTAAIGLPVLNLHIHEVLISAFAYHFICSTISPFLSKLICPKIYAGLKRRTRVNWDIHVTSLFQSTLISGIGLYQLFYNEERLAMDWRERVWQYDSGLCFLVSLATGYFVWDLAICVYYLSDFGVGTLAHAASALAVYGFGFRPVVNYYAPVFILFELSTPFLNFHWFFDKLDMTGSAPQLYNGIVLMATFAGSRLVWGTYNFFTVFPDILKGLKYQDTVAGQAFLASGQAQTAIDTAAGVVVEGDDMHAAALRLYTMPRYLPTWIAAVYLVSYTVLMLLNVVWFGKMIATIRARFDPPFGTRSPEEAAKAAKAAAEKTVAVASGVEKNGVQSMEIEAKEVRSRRSRKA